MGEVFGHFDVRDHRMADRPATAGTADRLAILRRHSWIGQLSPAANLCWNLTADAPTETTPLFKADNATL